MQYDKNDIQRLIEHVETVTGRKVQTPRDFDFLYHQIEGFTNENISISTLKRIWGYTKSDYKFSSYTLDILARMIGYSCYDAFLEEKSEIPSSQFFVNQKLYSEALEPGEKIKLTWKPKRVVVIEYKGHNKFIVKSSENSKLQIGDTFHCSQFMEYEPLILTHIIREGIAPCDYICGKQEGIRWSFL